jgi:excisionase family DNA binding protein
MAKAKAKVDLQTRKYLSRQESADYLGVCRRTIDRRRRDGTLPTKRVGKRVLILREDLDRLAESGVDKSA